MDLRVYGCCFYKWADGSKVRVHPQDVRFIKGEPRDSSNTVVEHQQDCPHGIRWPHPCQECDNAQVIPEGWCPICGNSDGTHKPGCQDGSELP